MPRYIFPRRSMYGIFTYIYHRFKPNVGRYTIHGAYGFCTHSSADPGLYQLRKAFYPEEGWGFLASLRFQGEIWLSLRHWVCKGGRLRRGDLLPKHHHAPRDFVSGTMFRLDYEQISWINNTGWLEMHV